MSKTPRTELIIRKRGEIRDEALYELARELEWENQRLRTLGNELRDSCTQFGWTSAEYEYPRATKRIKDWDQFLANTGENQPKLQCLNPKPKMKPRS